MKKVLFTAIIAVALIPSAFGAPVQNVNVIINNAFKTSFPEATNVSWLVTENYAKATFVSDNVNTEAFYNENDDFIGTSKAISLDQLPVSAKRSFAKRFSSYTVKEAIQFDGVEETAYYISAENEKHMVILKVVDGTISVFKTTAKN